MRRKIRPGCPLFLTLLLVRNINFFFVEQRQFRMIIKYSKVLTVTIFSLYLLIYYLPIIRTDSGFHDHQLDSYVNETYFNYSGSIKNIAKINEKLARNATTQYNHEKYSSFQCIAGSHRVNEEKYFGQHEKELFVFPLLNPRFRTCKIRNICWENGKLIYYQDPELNDRLDPGYLMKSMNGKLFYSGAWFA